MRRKRWPSLVGTLAAFGAGMPNSLHPLTPHPRLFVRWFIQYNPLFTLSALSVFAGVLVLSRALGEGSEATLTLVLELYQWLVIGVGGLLYRRLCEHRPGVILGVIALVFLVDPTLQLGALAATGHAALTALWVLAFAAKWRALEACFLLRMSTSARLLPPLGAALVAFLPNARLLGVSDVELPAFLAIATFALVGAWFTFTPQVTSRRALGEVGAVMFPRLVAAGGGIFAAGLAYQAWNATFALGFAALLPAFGALFLVGVAVVPRERELWTLLCVGLFVSLLGRSDVMACTLAAIALTVASRRFPPRVLVGAVLAAVAAVEVLFLRGAIGAERGAFEEAVLVVVRVLATVPLLWLLTRRKAWSSLPALALIHARTVLSGATLLADQSAEQSGVVLVLAGFALIPLGAYLHRKASRLVGEGPTETAREGAPSTSAAPVAALLSES